MQTELHWVAGLAASCFYASRAIIRGEHLTNQALFDRLRDPAHRLSAELQTNKVDRERFLDHMAALSTTSDDLAQLAEAALTKTMGPNNFDVTLRHALTNRFADLENAFHQALPVTIEQLSARGEPLREQWEAKGPGLLHAIGQLTHPNVIPDHARVVLLYPMFGGGGKADISLKTVRIEAVLADPHPQLPEVLRLAWLISQLNLDAAVFSERIPGKRIPRAAAMAMLPALLAAAEELGLAKLDGPTVELALAAWHLESTMLPEIAQMLLTWWETYREKNTRLGLALTGLDRMLD